MTMVDGGWSGIVRESSWSVVTERGAFGLMMA